MTLQGILDAARIAGFRDEAALRRLARPGAVLRPGEKAEAGSIRGSKIGGLPSLAAPGAWPRHDGASLSFLAQVALPDLPPGVAGDLPREGLLSFFYDADQQCFGFDPSDKGKFAVLHHPDAASLAPAKLWPEDLPEEARFVEHSVRFEEILTLPPWESVLVADLALEWKQLEAYMDFVHSLDSDESRDTPRSHLLGHPDQIQGDMSLECAVVTSPVYPGEGKWAVSPLMSSWREQARDWRLLFQMHSFQEAGMCWGDLGCLYFWIREADLTRRNFGAAWVILQCY